MSRNKDIEFLHIVTRDPYSVCRARMKRNHWNICEALSENEAFFNVAKTTREMVEALTNSLRPIVEKTIEACKGLQKMVADSQKDAGIDAIIKTSD